MEALSDKAIEYDLNLSHIDARYQAAIIEGIKTYGREMG
jgi:hypothetical protein